eukprot:1159342-Pelagomonas_calceolata.AAC.2
MHAAHVHQAMGVCLRHPHIMACQASSAQVPCVCLVVARQAIDLHAVMFPLWVFTVSCAAACSITQNAKAVFVPFCLALQIKRLA